MEKIAVMMKGGGREEHLHQTETGGREVQTAGEDLEVDLGHDTGHHHGDVTRDQGLDLGPGIGVEISGGGLDQGEDLL